MMYPPRQRPRLLSATLMHMLAWHRNPTVDFVKGLEANPHHMYEDPLATRGSRRKWGNELTGSARCEAERVVARLQHAAKSRGILPKNFLGDFDKARTGYLRTDVFSRELFNMFGRQISPAEASLVAQLFMADDGKPEVNYRAFHEAVVAGDPTVLGSSVGMTATAASLGDAAAPARSPLAATGASIFGGSNAMAAGMVAPVRASNADEAMDSLIRQAAVQRIAVAPFLYDFDRLRKGRVTREQFKRALVAAKFDLTGLRGPVLEQLVDKFDDPAIPGATVHYPSFLAELEAATSVRGMERNPGATLETHARAVATAPRQVENTLPAGLEQLAERELDAIADKVAQRRTELVNMFRDFDRAHEGHITVPQFCRVLTSLQLMPETQAGVDAVVDRYRGRGHRAHTVNWMAFKERVDPAVIEDASSPGNGRMQRAALAYGAADARNVMMKVKAAVRRDRVRIAEFLRDADPLHRGWCTAHQLETALDLAGIKLTPPELAALARAYPHPAGADASGVQLVAWRQLSADAEAVNGPLAGLETDPLANVDELTKAALVGTASLEGLAPQARTAAGATSQMNGTTVSFAPADEAELLGQETLSLEGDLAGGPRVPAAQVGQFLTVMRHLANYVRATSALLTPSFLAYDRSRRGYVPRNQFVRACASLKLPAAADDMELIATAYATPDGTETSYVWFVATVDAEDVEAALQAILQLGKADMPTRAKLNQALGAGLGATSATALALIKAGETAAPRTYTKRKQSQLPRVAASLVGPARDAAGNSATPEVQAALVELRRLVALRGVRLQEHLRDYDGLRRGIVHSAKVQAVFDTARVSPGAAHMAALLQGFAADSVPGHVDVRALIRAVDETRVTPLERNPSAIPTMTVYQRSTALGAEAHADAELTAIMDRMAHVVQAHRMALRERFKEHDLANHGVVSRYKFIMILTTERHLRVDAQQVERIADLYAAPGQPDLVDFRAFLARVDSNA